MKGIGFAIALSAFACGVSFSALLHAQAKKSEPDQSNSQGTGDGTDVSNMTKIEDASLEELLSLDLEDRLGVTEAVSRTSESILRAPAALTTIDATTIRLSGATTLRDVLRSVPGVAVFRNAPGNYIVSLRGAGGLTGNNVILLVDGIPLNNPLDGTVSWDLVPLNVEDIERIEVVRGPVSPTYGANAYTGVINVVTRTSVGLTPAYVGRIRAGADFDGASVGSVSGRFLQIGKRVDFRWFMTAEHDATSSAPARPTLVARDAKPVADRIAMMGALTLKSSAKNRMSIELGQVWSQRSSMEHLAMDSELQSQRLIFGRVIYERRDETALLSSARVWAQGISIGINSDRTNLAGFSYDAARSLRGTGGADLVLRLNNSMSAHVGSQAAIERIEAPFIHPNVTGVARPSYGFYGGVKLAPTKTLDLLLTARGDLSPIAAKLEYSYRASAVYYTDTWGLRLSGASAFRTPSYVEATGRFIDPASRLILLEGTESIGSPRNTALELGATFAPYSALIITSTVYVSSLSNLMVEDFESVVRRSFHNDPSSRTLLGAELEATWRINDSLSVLPSFTVLNWLKAAERIDTNVGVPSQNSVFLAGLRLQGLFGNETWGYGVSASVASSREYNVRTGIPPVVLRETLPTTVRMTAALERQMFPEPSIWASLRLGASLPGDTAESPLPLAAPGGQSAILGIELRRE